MVKVLRTLTLLALILIGAVAYAKHVLFQWSDTPLAMSGERVIEFPRGTSLTRLSDILSANGVVSHPLYFRVWVRLYMDYSRFQAGKYKFEGANSPREVVAAIQSGEVYRPVLFEYTIPEGFTFKQTAARLAANNIDQYEQIMKLMSDRAFLSSLGIPGKSLEGFLYPATYRFEEIPDAREAIREAVETFFKKMPQGYEAEVNAVGLSLYEAVTFASLIELETRFEEEMPIISEVIWWRLNNKRALGIDASIIYGIEDYAGNIRRSHLKDAKNPYNTRIHRGLPPTPIGSPSVASLKAVLTPSDTGAKYYVLRPDTSGKHYFSKSLEEHNRQVRKLVQWQRERRRSARSQSSR